MRKIAYEAVQAICEGLKGEYFSVYDMSRRDDTLELGINWAAIGTTKADRAWEFAHEMQIVAGICEAINEMGLEITYTSYLSKSDFTALAAEMMDRKDGGYTYPAGVREIVEHYIVKEEAE